MGEHDHDDSYYLYSRYTTGRGRFLPVMYNAVPPPPPPRPRFVGPVPPPGGAFGTPPLPRAPRVPDIEPRSEAVISGIGPPTGVGVLPLSLARRHADNVPTVGIAAPTQLPSVRPMGPGESLVLGVPPGEPYTMANKEVARSLMLPPTSTLYPPSRTPHGARRVNTALVNPQPPRTQVERPQPAPAYSAGVGRRSIRSQSVARTAAKKLVSKALNTKGPGYKRQDSTESFSRGRQLPPTLLYSSRHSSKHVVSSGHKRDSGSHYHPSGQGKVEQTREKDNYRRDGYSHNTSLCKETQAHLRRDQGLASAHPSRSQQEQINQPYTSKHCALDQDPNAHQDYYTRPSDRQHTVDYEQHPTLSKSYQPEDTEKAVANNLKAIKDGIEYPALCLKSPSPKEQQQIDAIARAMQCFTNLTGVSALAQGRRRAPLLPDPVILPTARPAPSPSQRRRPLLPTPTSVQCAVVPPAGVRRSKARPLPLHHVHSQGHSSSTLPRQQERSIVREDRSTDQSPGPGAPPDLLRPHSYTTDDRSSDGFTNDQPIIAKQNKTESKHKHESYKSDAIDLDYNYNSVADRNISGRSERERSHTHLSTDSSPYNKDLPLVNQPTQNASGGKSFGQERNPPTWNASGQDTFVGQAHKHAHLSIEISDFYEDMSHAGAEQIEDYFNDKQEGQEKMPLETKVYVGGLAEGIGKEELEREFGHYGPLKEVWVAHNPPGFAFIEFTTRRDANKCIRALDEKQVWGQKLRVEFAKSAGPHARGGRRSRGGMGRKKAGPPFRKMRRSMSPGPPLRGRRGSPLSSLPPLPGRRDYSPVRRSLSPPRRSHRDALPPPPSRYNPYDSRGRKDTAARYEGSKYNGWDRSRSPLPPPPMPPPPIRYRSRSPVPRRRSPLPPSRGGNFSPPPPLPRSRVYSPPSRDRRDAADGDRYESRYRGYPPPPPPPPPMLSSTSYGRRSPPPGRWSPSPPPRGRSPRPRTSRSPLPPPPAHLLTIRGRGSPGSLSPPPRPRARSPHNGRSPVRRPRSPRSYSPPSRSPLPPPPPRKRQRSGSPGPRSPPPPPRLRSISPRAPRPYSPPPVRGRSPRPRTPPPPPRSRSPAPRRSSRSPPPPNSRSPWAPLPPRGASPRPRSPPPRPRSPQRPRSPPLRKRSSPRRY